MTDHGTFYWNELMTRDAARAMDFYAKILGWSYDTMPMGEMGDYHIVKLGDKMVGGIMEMPPTAEFEGVPDHWLSYVAVDDVDKRIAGLAEMGGVVHREPFDVQGVGRIAIIGIPGGAVQGWIVPSNEPM